MHMIENKDKKDSKLIDSMIELGNLLDKHYQLKGYKGYKDFINKNKRGK